MNDDTPALPDTLVFRLGVLGSLATDRFTARIAELDLKPKHAGLLTACAARGTPSQLELATLMGVAPSLIVALADHLESLGAIRRVRDPTDRRRQALVLTEHGRELLDGCAAVAVELDAELNATLDPDDRLALNRALGVLARQAGLPTG